MRLPANSIYSQHIFYFWWLESDLVVFRGILFKGAQYSLYIPEQLIVLVLLLHQKIHKYDNMSNVLCFRRDKRFTGDGECCFLRQFQLLMWLWGKAISGRAEWMKSRVLGRGLNLPCHIQRRATNKQGNESSFPPQDRHFPREFLCAWTRDLCHLCLGGNGFTNWSAGTQHWELCTGKVRRG